MTERFKRWLWHGVRIAVCAVALAWVFGRLNWDEVSQVWQASDKGLVGVAFVIFLPVGIIQSLRFVWMLKAQDITISYWESLKLCYTGNFFNLFVPAGSVGGDVVKAYYVAQHTTRKTEAITAVFLDRVVGLASFMLFAIVGCGLKLEDPRTRTVAIWLLVMAGVGVVGAGVLFSRRLRSRFRLDALMHRLPLTEQLRRVAAATLRMREHLPVAAGALVATFVLQAFVLSSFAVVAVGLGMKSDPVAYFVYLAIALIVAAIPISPGGLGTMEAAMTFFLADGRYGSDAQVVLLAAAMRVIQLAWALPGFGAFLAGACRPDPEKLAQLRIETAEGGMSGESAGK